MKLEYSRQTFEEASNIKFNDNPSSRSRVVPCGRTDGQTDMSKVIIAFRNSANAPRNHTLNLKTHLSFLHTGCITVVCREPFLASVKRHSKRSTERQIYGSTHSTPRLFRREWFPSHGSSLTRGEKQRSSGNHRQKKGWKPKFGLNAGKRRLSTPAGNQTHIFQSLKTAA